MPDREPSGFQTRDQRAGSGAGSSAPPVISLPKGGGAIRGIGEKFAANPVTGTGSLTIPIPTSPGRSGFGPQLSLSYDSGSGNGPFGFGWSLSVPAITRKTEKGLPRYQDAEESDVFVLSGAEELVPVLIDVVGGQAQRQTLDRTIDGVAYIVQYYRPRTEGLFARIERWTNKETEGIHWRSISRDNITTVYGRHEGARIADPGDPARVFGWLISQSYDDKGNAIVYEYQPEDGANVDRALPQERNRLAGSGFAQRYLKRIKYCNRTPRQAGEDLASRTDWLFEVVFDYDDGHYGSLSVDPEGRRLVAANARRQGDWAVRQDPFSTYRARYEVRTYRLCHRVLMFHHFPDELGTPDYLVRATAFTYVQDPIASFITHVTQSGYLRQADGSYLEKSFPSLELSYTPAQIDETVHTVVRESIENLPEGLASAGYHWADLDGEGLSGVITERADGWFYKRNLGGGHFGPMEKVATVPSLAALSGGRQQFMDLAGDGQLDLVEWTGPVPGFHERTEEQGWKRFRPFTSLPNAALEDPNLRFVDLTGDGHADVLISEDEVLTWYPSLGEEGFGPAERIHKALDEEKGPTLVFAEPTESIYLADMSGDGLTDLVRVRNGDVSYWPNLGYGRFGAKVTMANAPWFDAPDQFDQRRIRLGDVDGSGATDIIYVGPDGLRIYYNESGNGWSAPTRLKDVPPTDDLKAIGVLDLLGSGTACVVWSSPLPGDARQPIRYLDLMGGVKPHLRKHRQEQPGGGDAHPVRAIHQVLCSLTASPASHGSPACPSRSM